MSNHPDPFTAQPLRTASGIALGILITIVTFALIGAAIWAAAR